MSGWGGSATPHCKRTGLGGAPQLRGIFIRIRPLTQNDQSGNTYWEGFLLGGQPRPLFKGV